MKTLALLLALLLGCTVHAEEKIVDTRDGTTLTREQLVQAVAARDFILLGELHDNPLHHQYRAELLQSLAPLRPTVVAEHLEYGKTFAPQGDLETGLAQAGFDMQGWQWPLHRPLFQAIADAQFPLLGGNIRPGLARQIVREGVSALPRPWLRCLPNTRSQPTPKRRSMPT